MIERNNGSMTRTRGQGWSAAEWLLGIVGAIGVFLGLFIMFGNEDSSVGLGGEVSWTVGEISDAWMYGLLIGGGILLIGALTMIIVGRTRTHVAASPLADLLSHTGAFIIVNAFIWIQDIVLGDGLDYALWITVPWAIGLAIHAGLYLRERNAPETRAEFAEEAKRRELLHH